MRTQTDKYKFITQTDYDAVRGQDWPTYSSFILHKDIPDFVYNEIDSMLSPPKQFNHPSYCVLPFYGWEYPQNKSCCYFPEQFDLAAVKSDMLAGRRPSACQACWNLEDRGIKSDRILKNETFDFYYKKNLSDLLHECKEGKNHINHYKIDTSNTCNATCVTCGSHASSAWGKLEKKNGLVPRRHWRMTQPAATKLIDYKTAMSVNFRGGEPLLSKTNFYILEQLIKAKNTDCFVSFQTNGSLIPNKEQEALLSRFKNLNFSFSIDGVGPVFEYLRYPLKWSQLETTLAWFRQRNIDVSVMYTISNLNVLYHQQTMSWFEQNHLNYQVNLVYDPAWFAPNALPESAKRHINFDFVDCAQDQANYELFLTKIAEQDRWKGIHMRDYLPELCELLG